MCTPIHTDSGPVRWPGVRYKHFWKQRDESARQVPFGPEHYTEAGVLVTPDRGMHESAGVIAYDKYNLPRLAYKMVEIRRRKMREINRKVALDLHGEFAYVPIP